MRIDKHCSEKIASIRLNHSQNKICLIENCVKYVHGSAGQSNGQTFHQQFSFSTWNSNVEMCCAFETISINQLSNSIQCNEYTHTFVQHWQKYRFH